MNRPAPTRSRRAPAPPSRPAPSRFGRLARTHGAMAAGDAAMAIALADSVLFSLDAEAARGKVLLFLGISFVPFLFVAPLIGPAIDRMRGGRRLVVQIVTIARVGISVLMAFHADDVLLFPLAFAAMVGQKTYAISKNALVPSVVRDEEELVEANSKLGLISGLVGVVAIIPAGILQKTVGATGTMLYAAGIFCFAFVCATRLPREVVAAAPADRAEQVELDSMRVVLASNAMTLLRAAVGFTFFHLFFWFRRDQGFVWFGLSLGVSSVLTMIGNAMAPRLRARLSEETMLVAALVVVGVSGAVATVFGGVPSGVAVAGAVNFGASIGRLAFDSIVQRDAPDANQGRAFAQFETRFQLGWVVAGVFPVLLRIPGQAGFLVVAVVGLGAVGAYLYGSRALARGRTPWRPSASLQHWLYGPEGRAGTKARARESRAAKQRGRRSGRSSSRPATLPVPDGRRQAPSTRSSSAGSAASGRAAQVERRADDPGRAPRSR